MQINNDLIKAPKGTKYLSDIPNFKFPKGILNKRSTGCGGTHYALINSTPTIVAVPLTTLIQSKEQSKAIADEGISVFGRYAGHNGKLSDLAEYLQKASHHSHAPKLMVTYDSLPRLVKDLQRLSENPLERYHLLVDEYHMLLTQYDFRGDAIQPLLALIPSFKQYTLMTATPYKSSVAIPYFEQMGYKEVDWDPSDVIKAKSHILLTNKVYEEASKQLVALKMRLLEGTDTGQDLGLPMKNFDVDAKELFIFVNSVSSICYLIELAGLSTDEVDVVCSDTVKNRDKLSAVGIDDIAVPTPEGVANKPFTFCTSKAFIGVDFYSEQGACMVVVDVQQQHTILDIATELTQVAGRIRTRSNPFRGHVWHFSNTHGKYGKYAQSEKEYEAEVDVITAQSYSKIRDFNNMSCKANAHEAGLAVLKEKAGSYFFYLNKETGLFEFDEFAKAIHEFNWTNAYTVYKDGVELLNSYKESETEVVETTSKFTKGKVGMVKLSNNKIKYLKEYCRAKEEGLVTVMEQYQDIKQGLTDVVALYDRVEKAILSENGSVKPSEVTAFCKANSFREHRIMVKTRAMLPTFKRAMSVRIYDRVLGDALVQLGTFKGTSDWDQNFVSNQDLKIILNDLAKSLDMEHDTGDLAESDTFIMKTVGKKKPKQKKVTPKIKSSDIEKYTEEGYLEATPARRMCPDGKSRNGYIIRAYQ